MPDTAVVWSDAEVVLTLGPSETDDGDIQDIEITENTDGEVLLVSVIDFDGGVNGSFELFEGLRGQNFIFGGNSATLLDDFGVATDEYFQRYEQVGISQFLDYDSTLNVIDLEISAAFNVRSSVSGDDATGFDVAWDGTHFWLTYEDNHPSGGRRVEFVLFDNNGTQIAFSTFSQGSTNSAVALNANGDFVGLASSGGVGTLFAITADPSQGSAALQSFNIGNPVAGNGAPISDMEMVALTNGNFAATYVTSVNSGSFPNLTTTSRVETVVIDPAGSIVSGPTQVAIASGSGFTVPTVSGVTIEALSSGGYVVAYESNNFLSDSISIQRFDNAGNAVGQTLTLNGTTSGSFESEIELLELSDGRIQVAWRETQGDVERLVTQIIDYRDEGSFNVAGDYIGTVGDDVAEVAGETSAFMADGNDTLTYDPTGVDASTRDIVLDGGDGIDTLNLTSVDGIFYDGDLSSNGEIPMLFDDMGSSVEVGIIQGFENFFLGAGDDEFSGAASSPLIDDRPILDAGRGNDTIEFYRLDNLSTDLGVIVDGGIGDDSIDGDLNQDDILYGGHVSDTGRVIEATSFFGFAFNMDSDNTSLATAISLDNSFSLFPNANIENATTDPHATIFARGDGSGMHVYRFDVQVAGTIMTLDLDGGRGTDTGSQDLHLWLVDSEGNIIADNDDGPLGTDPGSVSGLDPQLTYLAAEAGTYYIVVSDTFFFDGDPETLSELLSDTSNFVDNGTTYALNVSVDQGVSDDDTINGLGGNDYIEGGRGADTLDGGDDIDTLGYRQSDAGVTVSLLLNGVSGGHATGDTISNFENVDGSNFDDDITGDDDPNVLRGFSGDDEIDGLGGDDVIDGGLGADVIDGGMGTNTVSFATSDETGVTVLLHTGMGTAGHATGDTYANIQNVTGSDFNDFIQGDGNANVLDGGDGNDTLVGRGGADELIGGEGFDTASYFDQAAGVTASLFTGMGAGGDTFTSIERLVGSNFNDVLIGRDGASDTLEGGMGNDTLRGNGGDDTMLGGDGADLFFSGFGADSHDGGAGTDTITYNLASAGVIVRLDIGQGFFNQADGDTYTNIENLVGSAFRDALTGTAVANRLEGRAGNDDLFGLAGSDTLLGGNGNDKLDGGTGFDVLTGGLGMDTFVFQAGYQADRITDFTDGDDVIDLTSFGFTSFSQVSALAAQQGNDTVINFGNGDAIRLVDFDVADFDANDVMI